MSFEKHMRRPTFQVACVAGLAIGALASFRGNDAELTSASQDHADEHAAEEQDDHGHETVVVDERRHIRPPLNVSMTIHEGSWLRAPDAEWYEKQKDLGATRFTEDASLADGDGGWVDSEDVFRLRYDEEEDVYAYWSWAGPGQLTRGRQDFLQYCSSCHGIDGDGYGRSAQWLRPSPRDFHQSYFKFTKVTKALPTDAALRRLIKRGLAGTPMLPWALSDEQLTDIIQYIKSLSPAGEGWRNPFTSVGDVVDAGEDPWVGKETYGIERGKRLYHGTANCASCHPGYVNPNELGKLIDDDEVKARPTYFLPVLKDSNYAVLGNPIKILPPDFTFHQVRAGVTPRDLFETIASGIKGTAMPQWKGALPDEDIWALAHYVGSLVSTYKGKAAARNEFMQSLRAGQ